MSLRTPIVIGALILLPSAASHPADPGLHEHEWLQRLPDSMVIMLIDSAESGCAVDELWRRGVDRSGSGWSFGDLWDGGGDRGQSFSMEQWGLIVKRTISLARSGASTFDKQGALLFLGSCCPMEFDREIELKLANVLLETDSDIRHDVAFLYRVMRIRSIEAVDLLMPTLKSPELAEGRLAAIELAALFQSHGHLGPEHLEFVPGLIEALSGHNPFIRQFAMCALSATTPYDAKVFPILVEALEDQDAVVREQAAWGLSKCWPEPKSDMTRALLRALQDPEPRVRRATCQTVAWHARRLPAEKRQPVLAALNVARSDSDQRVRDSAQAVLEEFGPAKRK